MALSIFQFALLAGTLVCLSAGQVLFKMAALRMSDVQPFFERWTHNYYLYAALAVYGLGTVLWVSTLRQLPLRMAYPAVAFSYLIVPLLSHFLLAEALSARTMVGALIIVAGVWISVS